VFDPWIPAFAGMTKSGFHDGNEGQNALLYWLSDQTEIIDNTVTPAKAGDQNSLSRRNITRGSVTETEKFGSLPIRIPILIKTDIIKSEHKFMIEAAEEPLIFVIEPDQMAHGEDVELPAF